MSKIKVDTVTNVAGSGAPNIPDGITIGGVALASINVQEHYAQSTEPSSPKNGAVWYDTDDDKAYVYINSEFYELTYTDIPAIVNGGNRGVFGGGNGSSDNVIDYISIPTPGNATDFGDLSQNKYLLGGCSNGSRGLFGGGYASSVNTNVIEYITISTPGNALDFGDLTQARRMVSALANATRGVFVSGFVSGDVKTMDYVTIATTGNAIDFGDLNDSAIKAKGPAAADATRGVIREIYFATDGFGYITINTTGNATTFGDSTVAQEKGGACADPSRALFAYYQGTIEYLTIQTLGNATDFGDLTDLNRSDLTGTGNVTRGVFAGGQSAKNTIDYVTIQTAGNATDFGDLTVGRYGAAGLSGD